ncbi:palmitoyltransferase PFA3 [Hypoxylon cercidicola]|nr:palmitoyltransferase PFA3 [Hypoxylon cercidicola]
MDRIPSPSLQPSPNMARRWARRIERYCCTWITYFPLAFVYGLTTWAVWVVVNIGSSTTSKPSWIGTKSSIGGVVLYLLLNWSYTTAVFTNPGNTTSSSGYSSLPTSNPPLATSFTVKSNGETRFCKKCQARKPDRSHHCSTCRQCVLKMDHHCPWLATCIGLRNYKPFLLFLIYTTLFCFYCFAVSGAWVYDELLTQTIYTDSVMPVNFIMLAVISGIIGLVVGAFTGWHVLLASRNQTTIECLEKTRYAQVYTNKVRREMDRQIQQQSAARHNGEAIPLPSYGQQLLNIHANALPGITRTEEGEVRTTRDYNDTSSPLSYEELEQYRARKRYEDYLDEQDSEKLPNAFDLGTKRNFLHLFGPKPIFWFFPIINTTGDGWTWEASPKWIAARDRIAREREEQRQRERAAGWGEPDPTPVSITTERLNGASRHYLASPGLQSQSGRRTPSKADRILGRDPNLYVDEPPTSVSMRTLNRHGHDIEEEFDASSDEEDAETQAMNLVTNGAWAKSGASGLLRKPSRTNNSNRPASSRNPSTHDDDGVD